MFYAFSYTPTASDIESAPHELAMPLVAGVIHQVDILFQDGCDHEEFVQIFDENYQVWPTNRGEKFRGNATVVSFREFYQLSTGNNRLTAKIWSTLVADWKEVIIQVGVLPKKIIQPLNFEDLLTAAAGIE